MWCIDQLMTLYVSHLMFSDQVHEIGSRFECWLSWVSDCTNYTSFPWKFSAYLCGNSVCGTDYRHVCISSHCHGKPFLVCL